MTVLAQLIVRLRKRLLRTSLVARILIGNAAVIIVGAVGGTLVTRCLTRGCIQANVPDLGLIALFATVGILLSLVVNYWLIHMALRPLHELREKVEHVQAGRARVSFAPPTDADPDIWHLSLAVRSMLDRLEGRTLQLRALSQRAINAQEEERKRIARELHDDTSQALSTLIINLERIEGVLPADAPGLRRQLLAASQLATRTLENLREVIYGLRPTILDDLGLAPAIRWYARAGLEQTGVQVQLDAIEELTRLSPQMEIILFRIAQEAINNVVRHANARTVAIGLGRENGTVHLWIEDDGHGFDVEQISGQALRLRRLGLLGIQERAELLDGAVTVDSAPGQGTRLDVRVPLVEEQATEHG